MFKSISFSFTCLLMSNVFSQQVIPPKIFDYSGLFSPDSNGLPVSKIVLPGYNPAPELWRYDPFTGTPPVPTLQVQKTYTWQNANNVYGALQMWDDCALLDPPLDSYSNKYCLQNTMNWLQLQGYSLNYAFLDFERSADIFGNVQAVVNQIKNFSDPKINGARVGQYNYYPGSYNYYNDFPTRNIMDRTSNAPYGNGGNAKFFNSGVAVSLPALYPLSSDKVHTSNMWSAGEWIDPATGVSSTFSLISPNERSALFWSSLEKISSIKRALNSQSVSYELIPYISSLQWQTGYELAVGQDPTREDYIASLKHYRMRGIDGFITFNAGITVDSNGESHGLDYTIYRNDMLNTWHGMDSFFNLPSTTKILNTSTNCTEGVEWSAVEKGNRVLGIVSNLSSGSPKEINWSRPVVSSVPSSQPIISALALPMKSPAVSSNSHLNLQYLTSYMENESYEDYNPALTFDAQGTRSWFGPSLSPSRWKISTPKGVGNPSYKVVTPVSTAYNNTEAWFKMPHSPGFNSLDKVSYSAMFYFNGTSLKLYPVNTTGGNPNDLISWTNSGPAFMISRDSQNIFQFKFRPNPVNNPTFQAINALPQTGWYEVRIDIDPTVQSTGQGKIYLRNVTEGARDFSLLLWDDMNTTPVENAVSLSLNLGTTRNPSNFDGWQVYATTDNIQFDNFNAGYSVLVPDDNFEHYYNSTLNLQGWLGVTPEKWETKTPILPGNNSKTAIGPVASGYNINAWKSMQNTSFEANDLVVYSALLNPGASGNVGFSPVNTTGANPAVNFGDAGPYFSIRTDGYPGFRIRGVQVNLDIYKATVLPVPGHWYEVQIIVDPTRTLPGGPSGRYGVGKVYVRDTTVGGTFEQLVFTNETTGNTTPVTEVRLALRSTQNPKTWNGWQVYGLNSSVQIDNLKAFLYPYKDFAVGGAVNSQMIGPNQ